MKIKRWEPEKSIEFLRSSIDRLIDQFFGSEIEGWYGAWYPPIEIVEEPEAFVAKVDLPGFSKDDIKVTVEENILRITGQRKSEKDIKDKNVIKSERYYGEFSRAITLPGAVDTSKIRAEYKQGVLTLTMPKKETAKARTIDIKVED